MCVFIFVRRIFRRLLPFALVHRRLLGEEGGGLHTNPRWCWCWFAGSVVNILPGPVAATSANDVNKAGPKSFRTTRCFLEGGRANEQDLAITVFLGGFRFVCCCVALIALHWRISGEGAYERCEVGKEGFSMLFFFNWYLRV